jgi:hypothetical protein
MITIGAKLLNSGASKLVFPDPVNLRVMAGN